MTDTPLPASTPLPTSNDTGATAVATLEILQQVAARTPFNRLTKTTVTACKDGFAELSVPFQKDFAQHHGFLHGGLIGYLADTAMAWAAASVAGDVLTSEYRVHFLAPGKGERFIGRGHVLKASRRQIVTRADIFAVSDGQEKLIATGTGTILRANVG